MPFTIIRQDITKMKVDAVVNAANTDLQMGGGVCGAIFHAAGAGKLQDACNKAAPIKTGEAAITPGFSLPAKYVIHAAGPVYHHWSKEQSEKYLRSAYTSALKIASENKCDSIAFPLISSGIYGYPKAEALAVATSAITDYLSEHDLDVYLAVFDKSSFVVSEQLMGEVESYIDEYYVDTHHIKRSRLLNKPLAESAFDMAEDSCRIGDFGEADDIPLLAAPAESSIDDIMERLDEPFADALLRLIDQKGKTDVEVYKKANIDRKLFSKIRSIKGYTPKKQTILALAISLELSLEETDDLLERAGYALSHAVKFDVIIEYFIINRKYDIFEINEILFKYDQPLLGS